MRADHKSLADEIQSTIRRSYGLATADLRTIRREFSKRLATVTPAEVIAISIRLLTDRNTITRFFVYEIIHHHRSALTSLDANTLEQLGDGIGSWADVDMFACFLSGPAWREHQVPDKVISKWARSEDRWWRRAAIVSTVPLNNKARGGTGDPTRTLDICKIVIDDRDDMVVKGLSWALRELAKREPKLVREFLSTNKERIAARVIREVGNKLETGLKNPKKF
jgi:3-methyladenine DNA glycosylase AlkD